MARGKFIDTQPSPENILKLWQAINALHETTASQAETIRSQAETIATQQTALASTTRLAQQAAVTAGKATSASSQSNSGGGGGTPPQHDSQFAVVQQAIADLNTEGEDLSGPCGSFKVTNRVVQYLRPSQPTVGLINKPSGNNCGGYSTDALMYTDGAVYDILIDAENAPPTGAAPSWSYAGQRPASDWRDPV